MSTVLYIKIFQQKGLISRNKTKKGGRALHIITCLFCFALNLWSVLSILVEMTEGFSLQTCLFCAKFGWLHIYGMLHMQLMHIILDNDVQNLHNKGEQEV